MKPRIRPIKDLYFRIIQGSKLDGTMNAQHAADALSRTGFIELIPHRSEPALTHYRDLEPLTRLANSPELPDAILNVLKQYSTDQGLGD